MIKKDDLLVMRSISICFKEWLRPEEARIYTGLERTQFLKKCDEYGVFKSASGYYAKQSLNRMLEGKMPDKK